MGKRRNCKLGDLITFQRGYDLPKKSMKGNTYPVIGSNGIIGFHNEYTTEDPSITIGRSGNVGNPYIYYGKSWSHNTTLYIKEYNNVDPIFIYYFLKTLDLGNFAGGSAVPTLNRNHIHTLEVIVPDSVKDQKEIADILRVFDKKIENNNMINKNLAEQSQAIFKEYMDKYPYILTPLGEFAEIIDCLHSKKPEAVENTTSQLLQLNNITDSGFLDLSSKYYISESDYENWTRKCEIVEGDCVITNVGRIGAVSQAPVGTHAAMGRNMTCIRLKKNRPFYSYLITALLSNHIRKEIIKNTDEGTIMGALNVKNIPLLRFPEFEPAIMVSLEDILHPIRKNIEQNYLSNQTLSQLRDSLLPKLMSNEINISDIDL